MNRKAQKLWGDEILKDKYQLFYKIPTLLKYYYPQITGYLKYKNLSGSTAEQQKLDTREEELYDHSEEFKMLNQHHNTSGKYKVVNLELFANDITGYFFSSDLGSKLDEV